MSDPDPRSLAGALLSMHADLGTIKHACDKRVYRDPLDRFRLARPRLHGKVVRYRAFCRPGPAWSRRSRVRGRINMLQSSLVDTVSSLVFSTFTRLLPLFTPSTSLSRHDLGKCSVPSATHLSDILFSSGSSSSSTGAARGHSCSNSLMPLFSRFTTSPLKRTGTDWNKSHTTPPRTRPRRRPSSSSQSISSIHPGDSLVFVPWICSTELSKTWNARMRCYPFPKMLDRRSRSVFRYVLCSSACGSRRSADTRSCS